MLARRERVAEEIRGWIVQGMLRPGQRLVERELCERLEVSRATLRETFRQLEGEGLIVMTPNKGPTVAAMSSSEAQSVYEVREVLECCAIRLFVERASRAQVTELGGCVKELRSAHQAAGARGILSVKEAFYRVLYAGAANPVLSEQARGIQLRLAQLRVRSLSQNGRPEQSIREVESVYKSIRAGDAVAAEAQWRTHIRHAAQAALVDLDVPGALSVAELPTIGSEDKGLLRAVGK
jgi:DNA-binding GntR family transcriptional regulator